MKVLLLGGCGFIGSHLADHLIARGFDVRVLDRNPERFRDPLAGVDYVFGDFRDRMTVIEALSGVDAVVHLVSTTFPSTADLDPVTDVQDNLVGTLTLLETMESMGIHRLLFLSSGGTVYGVPARTPIPEDHPLRPINSYGIVKASIEHYITMYARTRGLRPLVVRASNPYGPRQGHSGVQGVVSTFLNRIVAGQPLEIWGDGSVVRDYLHVRDLAEFCARAIGSDLTGTFNVGSGRGTSLRDIIARIETATGTQAKVQFRPGRPEDVPCSILDVSRAREALGWQARTELGDGITETLEWIRSVVRGR